MGLGGAPAATAVPRKRSPDGLRRSTKGLKRGAPLSARERGMSARSFPRRRNPKGSFGTERPLWDRKLLNNPGTPLETVFEGSGSSNSNSEKELSNDGDPINPRVTHRHGIAAILYLHMQTDASLFLVYI